MKAYQYRMGEPIAALQIVDLFEQDVASQLMLSTNMLTTGFGFRNKIGETAELADEPELKS